MKEPKALGEYCYLHAFTYQNRLFYLPKQTVLVSRTDCFVSQLIKENEDKSKFVQTY